MPTLKTTSRGQVTLRKEIFEHLGVKPGSKMELELLPGGAVKLHAPVKTGRWEDLAGILKGKSNGVKLTIEEINEAIAEAGAGAGMGE